MNQRIEKSARILSLNGDQEGEELWVGMYDLLFDYQALLLDYQALLLDNAALRDALREIAKGEGRFSRYRLAEASSTVEDMKAIAVAALAGEEKP